MVLIAEQAGSGGGSTFIGLLPIILLIGLMYFLMIRPQSRRRREAQQMQSALVPGDEIQTVGGLFATVTDVDDESVILEPSPGVSLRFARGAVARVITKQPTAEDVDDDGEAGTTRTVDEQD